jgi:hypothetical protein
MAMTLRWARRVLAVAAGLTLAASGAAWAVGSAKADTHSTRNPAAGRLDAALSPFGPAPTALRPATTALRPATTPSEGGRFVGVAATSARNAWAVGLQGGNVLIMHYSGSRTQRYRWRVSFTKTAGFLSGVAATSADNAWAVGGTNWFSPQSLIEHWNGTTWTQVPAPTPSGTAYFDGVAATSATNAWAVGVIGDGPAVDGSADPLIEHWNGQSWSQADYPEPAKGYLTAVAAISANDVWVTGHIGSGPGTQTLIEHWNGQQWKLVPSNAPGDLGTLGGVAGTGPDNAWVAGYDQSGPGGDYESLIEHWNGQRWSVVPSPNPTGQTDIWRVAAASPDDAWAVGYTNPNTCSPQCATLTLHWNGKQWTTVPSASPGSGLSLLADVAIISADDAWAVGSYNSWSTTLIEHWNGTKWIWHLAR